MTQPSNPSSNPPDVPFSAQLRDWALHNIDRGIPPAPLARAMVEQGFDARLADALIHAFWMARATGAAIPERGFTAAQVAAARYVPDAPRIGPGQTLHAGGRRVRVAARLDPHAGAPACAVLDGVLDPDECAQLIALARPRLARSTIVDPGSGKDTVSTARTSEGMFFRLEENELVACIDRRVSDLMGLPLENGEGLQVLRYPPGAASQPHYDFLMPSNAANRASVSRSGQRVATLVMYLNDVEEGGETVFPESGFAASPREGSALWFEYCNAAGQLDPQSLHAGATPLSGEKWIVTKWMRQRRFASAG
ncbi:2OG-Fe(II) oxygenase [Massilia sp. 9096]|uniref:2OG-Fe(II) oxygenase n=1 Tax=Massilia sp. 9096 TaxID=1500894 RepID=UPI00068EC4B0|nr:2OG-Fe(II) oxygenase [Massilia sp. 9096]